MTDGVRFTPTEQRIVDLLSDGRYHTLEEMRRVMGDELADTCTVTVHLFRIRKKIKPHHQAILREKTGPDNVFRYRHVRILASPNAE